LGIFTNGIDSENKKFIFFFMKHYLRFNKPSLHYASYV